MESFLENETESDYHCCKYECGVPQGLHSQGVTRRGFRGGGVIGLIHTAEHLIMHDESKRVQQHRQRIMMWRPVDGPGPWRRTPDPS
ncbi:hypothetical protein ACNF49_04370 [Actinomadura sp. ATCC 39365]